MMLFKHARRTVFFILMFLFLCSAFNICEAGKLKNPVAPDGADPWVTFHDGLYHYCFSDGSRIMVSRAPRIQDALNARAKVIWQAKPDMPCSDNVWAPELHFLDGRWYVYFAADDGNNDNHRMYVLAGESGDSQGKFNLKGQIAAPTNTWAIDGTVLEHKGQMYFVWSGWEGDTNIEQNLYIAPMSDPLTISGERVMISTPRYAWEKIGQPFVNEGPQVLKHGNRVFIIYSASGSWTDDYCLGQLSLVRSNPLDPKSWRKKMVPVFARNDEVAGPGHCSFTRSPDGTEDWIVYHAAKRPGSGWDRNIRMQKFTWDSYGNPDFGTPIPSGVAFDEPSE